MRLDDHRYRNDPVFKALADSMYAAMKAGTFTPTDVREALLVASLQIEAERLHGPLAAMTEPE